MSSCCPHSASGLVGSMLPAHRRYDYEPPRGIYWSYWPAPEGCGTREQYPAGMHLYRSDNLINIAFQTDDNQLLLGVLPLKRDIAPFRGTSAPVAGRTGVSPDVGPNCGERTFRSAARVPG
jgi:hypothetical protein